MLPTHPPPVGGPQRTPLTVPALLDRAARWHGDQAVVSLLADGSVQERSYAAVHARAKRCAAALRSLGVRPGDRVATLALNSASHLEVWYGAAGCGAILHSLNPKLYDADIAYIAADAADAVVFFDADLLPLAARLRPKLPTVRAWVVLVPDSKGGSPADGRAWLCYEELLHAAGAAAEAAPWTAVPEDAACGLCYTSGTTGRPKGVLFTHRSAVLHAVAVAMPDVLCLKAVDTALAVVPLYHANAWGLAHACPLVGARLVLPGPHLDGPALARAIPALGVTTCAGVPTVFLGLLAHLQASRSPSNALRPLQRLLVGGAACPPSLITEFAAFGVDVQHAWGMTELSPIGTAFAHVPATSSLAPAPQLTVRAKQGRVAAFVDMRVVAADGAELPRDGAAAGDLQVRGPFVVQSYYKAPTPAVTADGWFSTGDVATIDGNGYMQIVDRDKDVIKSGGEWVSSVQVECAAQAHPGVAEAACVGVPDARYSERPLLVVVRAEGRVGGGVTADALRAFLADRMAKWWVPDRVEFVDAIPHTATGKISKLELRKRFGAAGAPGVSGGTVGGGVGAAPAAGRDGGVLNMPQARL